MQEQTNKLKKVTTANYYCKYCWTIDFLMKITSFVYGNRDTTLLYLLGYPVLFVSTILTICKSLVWFFNDLTDSFNLLHFIDK